MTAIMPADAAAWVRAHAWTGAMRKTHRTLPRAAHTCACQSGTSLHCRDDRHHRCVRGTPLRTWAAIVCWIDGEAPLNIRDRDTGELVYYQHVTDTSATGPRQVSLALVWLADRVCRWICPCDCHTAPPEPVQLDLFAGAA